MKRTRRRPRYVAPNTSANAGPVIIASPPDPKLYFDTVKEDAVGLVVRHLSSRPHLDSWMKNVNARDALIAVGSEGVLGKVSRDMFTELSFKLSYNFAINQSSRALYTEDEELLFSLLRSQASKLTALSFRWDGALKVDTNRSLFEACRTVRVLVINDRTRNEQESSSLCQLLAVCGDTLHELQIYGDGPLRNSIVKSISRHCDSLVSLSLSPSSCTVPLKPIFYAIGRTLRKLELQLKSPSMTGQSELSSIKQFCPRLEDVSLSHQNSIPLLFHLGAGLRIVRFAAPYVCPDLGNLQTLFERAPNCAVDASLVGVPYNPEPFIKVAASRLRVLHLRHWFEPSADFAEVASSLCNLEDLTLGFGPTSRSFVEAFFSTPKVHLRKLSLDDTKTHYVQRKALNIAAETSTISVLLDILANNVTTVRYFECKTSETLNDTHCARFLSVNEKLCRILIKYETLYESRLRTEREVRTAAFFRGMKRFPSVKRIEIEDASMRTPLKILADACVCLRSRQIVVVVGSGSVQYLPTVKGATYQ